MAQTLADTVENSHLYQPPITKIVDGSAVRFRDVCVYEFRIADTEDPDIIAGEPMWQWQNSEAGQFVMAHADGKPYWMRSTDYNTYGHVYRIMARLSEQNECFWRLKWSGQPK